MSDGVLRRLDFYVAVDETRARTKLVADFAQKLRFTKSGNTLAAGELPAATKKSDDIALLFHVDRIQSDATNGEHGRRPRNASGATTGKSAKLLFTHVTMARLGKRKRIETASVLARRRRIGASGEALFELIGRVSAGADVLVSVDARLTFEHLVRRHPILAPPLLVDGQLVGLSGAEYRGAKAGEAGLQDLKWSESRGGTNDVHVSYGYPWSGNALTLIDCWKNEESRCLTYIEQVL